MNGLYNAIETSDARKTRTSIFVLCITTLGILHLGGDLTVAAVQVDGKSAVLERLWIARSASVIIICLLVALLLQTWGLWQSPDTSRATAEKITEDVNKINKRMGAIEEGSRELWRIGSEAQRTILRLSESLDISAPIRQKLVLIAKGMDAELDAGYREREKGELWRLVRHLEDIKFYEITDEESQGADGLVERVRSFSNHNPELKKMLDELDELVVKINRSFNPDGVLNLYVAPAAALIIGVFTFCASYEAGFAELPRWLPWS